MLHELIYTSAASRHMSEDDLLQMLEQAREKNARLDVTGLLFYYNREFVQLLEGPKHTIFELYEQIAHDDRHRSVLLFWDAPIKERSFRDWSMGFATGNMANPLKIKGFSNFIDEGLHSLQVTGEDNDGRHMLLTLRELLLQESLQQPV